MGSAARQCAASSSTTPSIGCWLEEYHFDGLRLDAVDAIRDDSAPDFLAELAAGRERHVHLILENDHNAARYLVRDRDGHPRQYTAQWNDDLHHALHILLTGEADGCRADFQARPVWYLGRCLAQGFGYQGEPSAYRHGTERGEPSRLLLPTAFVSFLQNHDQAGNRPFGERIHCLTDPVRQVERRQVVQAAARLKRVFLLRRLLPPVVVLLRIPQPRETERQVGRHPWVKPCSKCRP